MSPRAALRAFVLLPVSLAAACAASAPPPDAKPPAPLAVADRAPRPTPTPEAACWERFVSYCPDEGPPTCMASDGEVKLSTCASAGGHCVAGGNGQYCVTGPAVCDHLATEEGTKCEAGLTCGHVSRMGNSSCTCTSGRWSCAHVGI